MKPDELALLRAKPRYRVEPRQRSNIARSQAMSANHGNALPRPAADADYLHELATRLAEQAGLPLDLAERRVMAMAISAKPRLTNNGSRSW